MIETRAAHARPADEWRYLRAACLIVLVLAVAQVAGWLVYRSVDQEPTALEQTERCLRREKLLPLESIRNDAVVRTARGGALATRVEGNGVHVAFARSDDEAAALVRTYLATAGRKIALRLDVRGRVVYVWEQARVPRATERQTMYDCWYE